MTERATRLAALLAVALLLCPATASAARLLLASGHDRGDRDQPALRYAQSEAREFAAVMQALGGVEPGGATVLLAPDRQQVLDALDRLAARAKAQGEQGERVEVFVYFSGHARSGALSLGGEQLPLAEVRAALEAIPADVVVAFVDACAAGGLLRSKGLRAAGEADYAMEWQPVGAPSGRVLVSSSGVAEAAFESDRAGGSLFARSLVAALRGAADGDADGRVTLSESYDYLYAHTLAASLAEAGTAQHPHAEIDVQGAGPLVMTRPGRGGASVELPASLAGAEVWIVDEARARAVLEVVVPADRGLTVALYPGRFTVYVRRGERARTSSVVLAEGERRALDATDGRIASSRPLRTRGGAVVARRWELAGGLRLMGPLTARSAIVPAGWFAVEVQPLRLLRFGGALFAGGGRFEAEGGPFQQAEVGGDLGLWLSPLGKVQPLVGGRFGVEGVFQSPLTGDARGWYSVEQPTPERANALGLRLVGELGLLLRVGGRGTFRLSVGGGATLIPDGDGGLAPRGRVEFNVGVGAAP